MSDRRSRKSQPTKRKASMKMPVVSDTALAYNGPVVPEPFRYEKEVRIEVQRLDTDLVTSGGGVLNNVIGSNPASYTNWTSLSGAFEEYRVLAMECHYEPYNRYNSSINQSPLYVCVDRGDATALTSYSNALEQGSIECFNTADPWTKSVKMSGAEDAIWTPVSTGYSSLYIKLYASILSNSVSVGRLSTTVLVQFRGTR